MSEIFIKIHLGITNQISKIQTLQIEHHTSQFPYSTTDIINVLDKALRELIEKMEKEIKEKKKNE